MFEDQKLMKRYNRGDVGVLRDIYGRYKDDMVGLSAALLHDTVIAEDVVHDVFARLIEKQGTLKISSDLKRYLITSVVNTVRQVIRGRKAKPEAMLSNDIELEQTGQASPEAVSVALEARTGIANAISALPYDQREVILLRHFSDLKFKTIADLQEVSINTVQGRYRYGLDKLRSLLNGELEK